MFDHVTLRTSDREASAAFYTTVLATLSDVPPSLGETFVEWEDFSLAAAGERPVTRGLHVGFAAPSRAHVDAFWQAGVDAGYADDGAPGPRPQYREDYYGGFLRDPDGNSAEAVHHGALRGDGVIDHVWIRVADVAASRRFYAAVAPHAGFALRTDRPDFAHFRGTSGSFSLVAGSPRTEHVHLAFPATRQVVDAFHAELTAAGYRDDGAPGERPQYHRGYYGAFVLDPDGNSVELVRHDRPAA